MPESEPTSETVEAKTSESEAASSSVLAELAGRGEEAVKRMYGELSDNPRMQDVRQRLDKVQHSVLSQLRIATMDDIEALRKELSLLEQRLSALEQASATDSGPRGGGER
jgi:hypothetical protein